MANYLKPSLAALLLCIFLTFSSSWHKSDSFWKTGSLPPLGLARSHTFPFWQGHASWSSTPSPPLQASNEDFSIIPVDMCDIYCSWFGTHNGRLISKHFHLERLRLIRCNRTNMMEAEMDAFKTSPGQFSYFIYRRGTEHLFFLKKPRLSKIHPLSFLR